jgi:hypothetical protein
MSALCSVRVTVEQTPVPSQGLANVSNAIFAEGLARLGLEQRSHAWLFENSGFAAVFCIFHGSEKSALNDFGKRVLVTLPQV